ncbi:hypothetical protein N657DRAFT_131855 [Parathielavia appendiculata]|uniref:Uncharacterized protein n=1 Tax=Parathielavia appendiculata TaxID=2587402 RepID=A0AAN6Z0Y6_9PEZI|nr:hypothetical protein N657DRAFT_131855 [Parathielavia appendiculata]
MERGRKSCDTAVRGRDSGQAFYISAGYFFNLGFLRAQTVAFEDQGPHPARRDNAGSAGFSSRTHQSFRPSTHAEFASGKLACFRKWKYAKIAAARRPTTTFATSVPKPEIFAGHGWKRSVEIVSYAHRTRGTWEFVQVLCYDHVGDAAQLAHGANLRSSSLFGNGGVNWCGITGWGTDGYVLNHLHRSTRFQQVEICQLKGLANGMI